MSRGRNKTRVVYADENFEVVHHRNRGRQLPEKISIRFLTDRPMHTAAFIRTTPLAEQGSNALDITVDELFNLAEVLDDLCDYIEDAQDNSR